MQFIDHRTVQRGTGTFVALPVESGVDDDRLGHSPRIITEILSQIFLHVSDDIAEHLIRPAQLSGESLRLRFGKKFRTFEAKPAYRIVRSRNPKSVQLLRTQF